MTSVLPGQKLLSKWGNEMYNKIKILIADDTSSMRNVIKGVLIKAGFTNFDEAENGKVVLQKLSEDRFHLVVCDWDMPVMDGLAVLRDMRADESLYKIPFILVTAIADAQKVVSAIEQGVDDYIIKPLKPDDFIHRVTDVLKRSKLTIQA